MWQDLSDQLLAAHEHQLPRKNQSTQQNKKMTVNDEVAWQNYLAHKVQHIVVMLYNMSKLTMMLIVIGHTLDPKGLSLQNSDPSQLHAGA